MEQDKNIEKPTQLIEVEVTTPPVIDEKLATFVYGSVVIKDVGSGNILIKKSF